MRILIIENEHKTAQVLKQTLEQDGYSVDVCYDGDSGYEIITTTTYDLAIISKLVSGKHKSDNIIKTMRDSNIHTPVIMLSPKTAPARQKGKMNFEADAYLTKPFAVDELLEKITALLRKPGEEIQTILSIGDLTLNTITYEVKRNNTPIVLTNKEFCLLKFLLRNQGKFVNKDMIITHVWDYTGDVLPNTIEVYMKYLRNKVEVPFDGPKFIHTSRGFGYKVEIV